VLTLPASLFGLLIALLYGAVYHLIRGGSIWRLFLYLALSLFGFVAGHLIGLWRGWVWYPIGSLNLGVSTLGSLLILILGDWLSRGEGNRKSKV
jgi:hypothetical protein